MYLPKCNLLKNSKNKNSSLNNLWNKCYMFRLLAFLETWNLQICFHHKFNFFFTRLILTKSNVTWFVKVCTESHCHLKIITAICNNSSMLKCSLKYSWARSVSVAGFCHWFGGLVFEQTKFIHFILLGLIHCFI